MATALLEMENEPGPEHGPLNFNIPSPKYLPQISQLDIVTMATTTTIDPEFPCSLYVMRAS